MSKKKELTEEILQMIRDGGQFVKEQAPQLAQDVLGEAKLNALISMFGGGIGLLACLTMVLIGVLLPERSYGGMTTNAEMLCIFGGLAGAVGFVFTCIGSYSLYFLQRFPKLYIYRNLR